MGKLLVVGVGRAGQVKTPFGEVTQILGGSATYFSTAASYFTSWISLRSSEKIFPINTSRFSRAEKSTWLGWSVGRAPPFVERGRSLS